MRSQEIAKLGNEPDEKTKHASGDSPALTNF
jgi:hypothetical protein